MKTYPVLKQILVNDDDEVSCHKDCGLLAHDEEYGDFCLLTSDAFVVETASMGRLKNLRTSACIKYTERVKEGDLEFINGILLTHIERNLEKIRGYGLRAGDCLESGDKELAQEFSDTQEEYKEENAKISHVMNNLLTHRKDT